MTADPKLDPAAEARIREACPIKPEDIKPGDWIKFRRKGSDQERTAIVMEANALFTDDGLVSLAEVLEVRRG